MLGLRCAQVGRLLCLFPRVRSSMTSAVPKMKSAQSGEGSSLRDSDTSNSKEDVNDVAASRGRVHFLHHNSTYGVISLQEALRCLRAYSLLPRPESVEVSLAVNMLLKKKKRREPFRGTLLYPRRFGIEARVLLIAEDDVLTQVKCADFSGGKEMIEKLRENPKSVDFDICVTTPTMYESMRHLQRVLRTKMPNPRRGTVVVAKEMDEAIQTFQQSKTFRCSKYGVLNMAVGKLDFEDSAIEANVRCLLDSVLEHRGAMAKTMFLECATLSSNFGPGFIIAHQDLL